MSSFTNCNFFILIVYIVINLINLSESSDRFPDDFIFGVSTASYQVEGGWNEDGKGESIWDRHTHTQPNSLINGDVACDSYHLYERDIEMVSELGTNFYRFSISWTRVFPSGLSNNINMAGINYYNKLIDGLIKKNITPVVTIFHWDLPQKLQDLGGWTNPLMADYFEDYADFLFKTYGDRVKHWVTINEPDHICIAYGEELESAPSVNATGIGIYLCGHSILLAHAKAYHLYNNNYRSKQKGFVGIILAQEWREPETNSELDVEAAEQTRQFELGWFAHPIFSKEGNYPYIMRKIIRKKSLSQGFRRSRLPEFSKDEVELVKGSSDFFGLNHYSTWISYGTRLGPKWPVPSWNDDISRAAYQKDVWRTGSASWNKNVPWGLRKLLNWVKNEYGNPTVLITENGFSSSSGLMDYDRIDYIRGYLKAVLDAKFKDKCNIIGYAYWSLMDDFEWASGYRPQFGLFHVDFKSPNKTRTMRKSGYYYKNVIKNRVL